ncbi:hypothetical protein PR048_032256 [Dryococelus australis]|uniref:Uncharacterized protein n=1 Tax=Dryococelus australis TaxID=614101 RepID=A0ABQ9G4X7_9NEOP|nr:hypothetical protein PR048_032256 [Dryococelus australis]
MLLFDYIILAVVRRIANNNWDRAHKLCSHPSSAQNPRPLASHLCELVFDSRRGCHRLSHVPLVGGFPRGSPVPPPPGPYIPALSHTRFTSASPALKTTILRAGLLFSLRLSPFCSDQILLPRALPSPRSSSINNTVSWPLRDTITPPAALPRGAVVAQWLGRSPPTKAIRAQSPAGSLLDSRTWESCWTMPLAGGFLRDTPVSTAFVFQRRYIRGSHFMSCSGMTGIYGSQLESPSLGECCLALGSVCHLGRRGRRPSAILVDVTARSRCQTQGQGDLTLKSRSQISDIAELQLERRSIQENMPQPMRVIEVSMEQRRNEGAGKREIPEKTPPTNGIVRHDSHMRKSGVTRPGIEPDSPWWEAITEKMKIFFTFGV